MRGDFKAALSDYDQAIGIKPRAVMGWSNRGLARQRLNDLDGATEDFNHALSLARTWANRGLALLMQGRTEEAEQSFTRCRELGGRLNPVAEEWLHELRGRGRK